MTFIWGLSGGEGTDGFVTSCKTSGATTVTHVVSGARDLVTLPARFGPAAPGANGVTKIIATGLRAGTWYWYGFEVDGVLDAFRGRVRTAPVGQAWFKDTITAATEPLIIWQEEVPWLGGGAAAGSDTWRGFNTERTELAAFIAASGKNLYQIASDMHAVAYVAPDSPYAIGGFAVAQCGPIDQSRSSTSGAATYDFGPLPDVAGVITHQYGRFDVTDTGDQIAIAFTALDGVGGTVIPTQTVTFDADAMAGCFSAPTTVDADLIAVADAMAVEVARAKAAEERLQLLIDGLAAHLVVMDRGLVTMVADSGTLKEVRVNFTPGRFTRIPSVVVNGQSIAAGLSFARASAVDKDGFTLSVVRSTATATPCSWTAVDVPTDPALPAA